MTISIRTRMVIFAMLAILPAVIFVFYLNASEKNAKEKRQVENLVSIAKLYSEEHSQVVENARHLLLALSVAPQVNSLDRYTCQTFLSSILEKYQRYSNFGIANTKGDVICSAVLPNQKINVANTLFFKEAIKTKDFVIGEYRISQATGNAVLSFGYPLIGKNGKPRGVLYSSIDLSWLNSFTQNLSPDKIISILVLDQNGTVLARDPDPDKWVGKTLPEGPLRNKISDNSEGSVEDTGLDGIKRTYAFEKIGSQKNAPYIAVGVPRDLIFKETQKDFAQRVLLSLIVAGVCLGFAWWAGGVLIVRQVEALEKIDALKSDFVSLVSHQIRTPLTSIRWFTEILLTQPRYRLPTKQKNIVKDIHEAASRVISLVGTFLNISKIESGKINLSVEETNIEHLVRDVIKELKNVITKKKIKLNLEVDLKIPKAFIDQKLVRQVYLNLVGNAVKYSAIGGRVDVIIRKKGVNIVSEIRDKGIGIPASEKDKIFQKFSRAKNASSFAPDGAGLGLYLVKLIVESHRGRVWFKSIKGKGTSFFFSLPINYEVL